MRRFILVATCAVLLLSLVVPAVAAGGVKTVSINTDMTIVVNGSVLTPRNANGIPVDVIEYEGTTYAPVRALGEALGGAVSYDAASRTAYIAQSGSGVNISDELELLSLYKQIGDMAGHLDWLQMITFDFLNDAIISNDFEGFVGFLASEELDGTIGAFYEQVGALGAAVKTYEENSLNTEEFAYLDECIVYVSGGLDLYVQAINGLYSYITGTDETGYDTFESTCTNIQGFTDTVEAFAFSRWQEVFDAISAKVN